MAVLTDEERQQVWRGLMRYWSDQGETVAGVTKPDLQAAVNAIDAWIDTNQAIINLEFPLVSRNNLTQAQKTALFCAVAARRVSKAFALALFGEVD